MSDRKVSVTEASRHFADLVNRTYYRGESTMLVRSGEPVARVVPVGGASLLGRDWIGRWKSMPRLDSDDAEAFAATLQASRAKLELPEVGWD